jgi:A/G-specific adenine glycosylase
MWNEKQITSFRALVLDYYAANKRDLPWRQTNDPYKIMVSEIMLQQTQVERVIPKYLHWIERFPNIEALALSSLKEVLTHWSGLGYNRRGQNLLKAAQLLEHAYAGSFESFKSARNLKKDPLTTLPGIGSYTAAAIRAFAWNQPTIVIETNIRTVFIHHFFPNVTQPIEDKQLLPMLDATLDRKHPRDWYNALMDYGAHLKSIVGNVSRKSKSYAKQTSFEGSNRQLRGKILRYLLQNSPADITLLPAELKEEDGRVEAVIAQLKREALLVVNEKNQISIK